MSLVVHGKGRGIFFLTFTNWVPLQWPTLQVSRRRKNSEKQTSSMCSVSESSGTPCSGSSISARTMFMCITSSKLPWTIMYPWVLEICAKYPLRSLLMAVSLIISMVLHEWPCMFTSLSIWINIFTPFKSVHCFMGLPAHMLRLSGHPSLAF